MARSSNPRTSLTDEALQSIRARIVEGELELGAALSEAALAQLLGVSKTPVREALMRLKREGLVDIFPQRGTFVFQIDTETVLALCDFRRLIECAAMDRSCTASWGQLVDALERCVNEMQEAMACNDTSKYRRLDAEFHGSLFRFCGNRLLVEAHESIEFRVQSLRTRLSVRHENNEGTLKEHKGIVQALIKRNQERARQLLYDHIAASEVNYLKLLPDPSRQRVTA